MKKTIALVFLAVLFTGCTGEMMETHGDKVSVVDLVKGTKAKRGGVIRYLNGGLKSWSARRRANTEKEMEKFCSGPYEITAEGPRSKFGADMPIGSSVSLEVDQYTYIRFECTKP